MSELKNTIKGSAAERISELEGISTETFKTKKQRGKKNEKWEHIMKNCRTNLTHIYIANRCITFLVLNS